MAAAAAQQRPRPRRQHRRWARRRLDRLRSVSESGAVARARPRVGCIARARSVRLVCVCVCVSNRVHLQSPLPVTQHLHRPPSIALYLQRSSPSSSVPFPRKWLWLATSSCVVSSPARVYKPVPVVQKRRGHGVQMTRACVRVTPRIARPLLSQSPSCIVSDLPCRVQTAAAAFLPFLPFFLVSPNSTSFHIITRDKY